MQCHIYCRVSTERQAREGESLAVQEADAQREFDNKYKPQGYVLAGIYRDAESAGRKPLLQRAGGAELAKCLERDDIVIVPKFDRAFRSVFDLCRTMEIWRAQGVKLRVMDMGGIDTSTPEGELFMHQLAAFAQFERRRLGQRVKGTWDHRSRLHQRDPSVVRCPRAPYGFKVVRHGGKVHWVADVEIRKLGAAIVQWHDELKKSFTQIWAHMRKHRITRRDTKGRERLWESMSAIQKLYMKEKQLQLIESQREPLRAFMLTAPT